MKKGASPAKFVKTRSTGSNDKMDASMIGEIICQVLAAIQPMIANVVTAAVSASTKQIFAEMKATADSQTTEVGKVKQRVQLLRFDLDRLELYSRRESVRIYGIPESDGEDTNRLVIDLAADMCITVKPEDISVSHRLPAGRGPRAANRSKHKLECPVITTERHNLVKGVNNMDINSLNCV